MIVECSKCGRANRIPSARLQARARCGGCKEAILPVARPVPIEDAATFDELLRDSPLPVVVDFWADWCGPCHAVAPELARVAASQAGKAIIAKVNVDQLQSVAARYGIRSIPTLLRFDRGRETKRISGAQPAASIIANLLAGDRYGVEQERR